MDRLGLGPVLSYLLWLAVLTRPLLGYFRPVFSVTQQQTGQLFLLIIMIIIISSLNSYVSSCRIVLINPRWDSRAKFFSAGLQFQSQRTRKCLPVYFFFFFFWNKCASRIREDGKNRVSRLVQMYRVYVRTTIHNGCCCCRRCFFSFDIYSTG